MTLRQALGNSADRVHELVDQLLDSDDALIVLTDGRRATSFAAGFAMSPCQLELFTAQVEQAALDGRGTRRSRDGISGGTEGLT